MYVAYDDLDVYKKAFELACEIHPYTLSDKIPKFEQFGGLSDQIRRASRSVCANMAEGLSKNSSRIEERRFLSLALGSCNEVRVWLQFGIRFGYFEEKQATEWRESYLDIARILRALMKKRESGHNG